jgi:hypothetical protein
VFFASTKFNSSPYVILTSSRIGFGGSSKKSISSWSC